MYYIGYCEECQQFFFPKKTKIGVDKFLQIEYYTQADNKIKFMEKSRSWPSAHDWKSCIPQKGIEGSNPSFSAINNNRNDAMMLRLLFFIILNFERKLQSFKSKDCNLTYYSSSDATGSEESSELILGFLRSAPTTIITANMIR